MYHWAKFLIRTEIIQNLLSKILITTVVAANSKMLGNVNSFNDTFEEILVILNWVDRWIKPSAEFKRIINIF